MVVFEQGLTKDVPRAEPAEGMLTEPAMNDGRAAEFLRFPPRRRHGEHRPHLQLGRRRSRGELFLPPSDAAGP